MWTGKLEYQRGKWQWKCDQYKCNASPSGVGSLESGHKKGAGKIGYWVNEGEILDGLQPLL